MRGNGAPSNDPNPRYDDRADDDYDLLDDLADDEWQRSNARQRARQRDYRPRYSKPGRRPAAEREGAFNALLWLLDGATGIVEELRHNDLGLPEDFWVHAVAARKETLMALRAILDDWIDEEHDAPAPPKSEPPKRRGGIDIDF
ncbi:MAG TPA: hypothetical protein GYA08_20515 [Chloroflexi bacterium]|nr:hypothetical protein [Chloroflexota bacterium]